MQSRANSTERKADLSAEISASGHYSIDSTTVRTRVSAAGGDGVLIDELFAAREAGSPVSFMTWLMPGDDHTPST
jgi:hypothetical protein